MGRLRRFASMPRRERYLLLRALVCVAAARIGLWVLPVRVIHRWISKERERSGGGESVGEIVRAVTTASRYCPGATCLIQAIAAQAMLARSSHQSRIEIGISKQGEQFAAHAWLVCGGRIVLGGPDVTHYAPLAAWEVDG